MNQARFADDATAGGKLQSLKQKWDEWERRGPDFGYHANAAKYWLIMKEQHMTDAAHLFDNTGVQIYQGGTEEFWSCPGYSILYRGVRTEASAEVG